MLLDEVPLYEQLAIAYKPQSDSLIRLWSIQE